MKALIVIACLGATAAGARWMFCGVCCPLSLCSPSSAADEDIAPAGAYVEARTASVYAGACHYNSELVTAGREAVLAWHFEQGSVAGSSLAGLDVVAAVASSDNVSTEAARKSIVYVDRDADEAQRAALLAHLKSACGAALGEIAAVETADVEVAVEGETYRVKVGDVFALSGGAMPDRACCTMPYNVWYEPIAALQSRVVGRSEQFVWNEKRLAAPFERTGHNDAFLGRFGPELATLCCGEAIAAE
jgi:hypothetical protein